jgi:UDP-GlcNAc:undecaprenyl-phosphate/decaprenyl-phosphate GlcNAc-1-phosphate transferase
VLFPNSVYLVALVSALITSFATLPLWSRWCNRIGLVDDPGFRKIHNKTVPLAGGLAVISGILAPVILAAVILVSPWGGNAPANARHSDPGTESVSTAQTISSSPSSNTKALLWHGLNRRWGELTGIIGGAIGMLIVGIWDDKKELRPAAKFGGQLLIALFVAACGVRVTLFVPSLVFSYAITIFWILTVVNAFNFMDNMNGLCAGLGAIAGGHFAILAAIRGQYLVAIIGFLTCGALLGFLPRNYPFAKAFLGDAGSHMTGFLLAALAILPHFSTRLHPDRWAVLIPLIVLAVPLLDMVWVVILRWRIGQPFYIGDNNHLSHRLVRRGLSRPAAVALIWVMAALLGSFAYLL